MAAEETQDKLALPDEPVMTGSIVPTVWEDNWMLKASTRVVRAGLAPQGDTAQTLYIKMLKGRELGIPPMSAMTLLYVVNGRVATMGRMKLALVRKSDRYGYRFEPVDDPETEAKFLIWPRGYPDETYTAHWTIAQAKERGIIKNAWTKYPDFMLRWRCVSEGVDIVAPDVCDLPCVEELADDFTLQQGRVVLPVQNGIVPQVRSAQVGDAPDAAPAHDYRWEPEWEQECRRWMKRLGYAPEAVDAEIGEVASDEEANALASRLREEEADTGEAEGEEEAAEPAPKAGKTAPLFGEGDDGSPS